MASRIDTRLGVAGVIVLRGGRGEFRRMLWRLLGCVYGAIWLPTVMRRRGVLGVLGEDVLGLLAAKVNIRGSD